MAIKFTKKQEANFRDMLITFEEARDQLRDFLAGVRDDWQSSFEAKSDKWRESDAGEEAGERLNALEALHDELDNLDLSSEAITN